MGDRTSHSRPVGIGSTCSPQWSSTTPGAHNRVDELVAGIHGGTRYLLFRNLDIKDVRIVHAPPSALGAFGGDAEGSCEANTAMLATLPAGVLLLLGVLLEQPALIDVALILALLAAVAAAAFTGQPREANHD